jgi:hypothetical protein
MNGYATLIAALIVAIAIALVAEARTKPSVEDVALPGSGGWVMAAGADLGMSL